MSWARCSVRCQRQEEIIYYARQLQEKGVNVLVSMAGDGAVLIAENGAVFSMGSSKGTVKNLGAGDSMVAGSSPDIWKMEITSTL